MLVMKKTLFLIISFSTLLAQTIPLEGIQDKKVKTVAFTNATIHIDASKTISNGTLIIKNDKIISVDNAKPNASEMLVVDCSGKHIYPSFIELNSNYALPEKIENNSTNLYWNDAIKTHINAFTNLSIQEQNYDLIERGFGTVLSHYKDGILRGTGVLTTLQTENKEMAVLIPKAAIIGSLSKGSSVSEYPSSLIGTIALLRQFFYDADWYSKNALTNNLSIDLYNCCKNIPFIFYIKNSSDIHRLEKIKKEFGLQFHYVGNGDEYQRVTEAKNSKATYIIPLKFPKAYKIEDVYDADQISLEDLKHWEMAPSNAKILSDESVPFVLTSVSTQSSDDFFFKMSLLVKRGLNKSKLLESLTSVPAKMLLAEKFVGSLETNKLANFIITENELGDENFSILENWIQGIPYKLSSNIEVIDYRGEYTISSNLSNINGLKLKISGSKYDPNGEIVINDTTKIKVKTRFDKNIFSGSYKDSKSNQVYLISAYANASKKWIGDIKNENGEQYDFELNYSTEYKEEEKETNEPEKIELSELTFPSSSYGFTKDEWNAIQNKSYLIKNATVWTNEKEGILKNTDVITENGKIKQIGINLSCSNCEIIDGTNKHLTSGIIDEHSHIAITRGANEGTQSSTAEVRIEDAINAEDINIYRQLASGVTTIQLLHGSANAIGGQSAIIKLRWGKTENELLFEGATKFIKFALGENVKQSNWGDHAVTRYPQTRMGVESFFIEMFNRAKEYEKEKKKNPNYRKDIELETLNEILRGERKITCHSYVQSEINMLMKVAESFGFKINTFTHILEGYKVADKMKTHGANASTFSDWWAYKWEVIDAIPYNATMLTKVGVNTCVNSDDAEMARRLNHEAAKAIKYGGLTEEEAWKLCTYNAAKALNLDEFVGSVKVGKHADLVLWNYNPLSIYSRVEFTMIDGIMYYTSKRNEELIKRDKKEKNKLIQKMISAVDNGEPSISIVKKISFEYGCESLENQDYYFEILTK